MYATYMMYTLHDWYLEPPGGVGRDAHDVRTHAMVSVTEWDYIIVLGVDPCQKHCQVIGLRPTVYQIDYLYKKEQL